MRVLRLTMNSNYDEIKTLVSKALNFFTYECYITDEKLLFMLEFALRELVINGIEHGNNMIEDKKVRCIICDSKKRIIITVKDEGEGFILERFLSKYNESILRERKRGISTIMEMGFSVRVKRNRITVTKTKENF